MPKINNLCLRRPLLILVVGFAFFSLYNVPQVSALLQPCSAICNQFNSGYKTCNPSTLCDVPQLPNGNFIWGGAFNCCQCCPKSKCYWCFMEVDGSYSCALSNQALGKIAGNGTMLGGKSAGSSIGQAMGLKMNGIGINAMR